VDEVIDFLRAIILRSDECPKKYNVAADEIKLSHQLEAARRLAEVLAITKRSEGGEIKISFDLGVDGGTGDSEDTIQVCSKKLSVTGVQEQQEEDVPGMAQKVGEG
jgi:hypothetical protein